MSVSQTDPQIKALLEFEPVPRDRPRVDGWTAERQRAFIALLATTGSPRRASKALGMSPYGIAKLREANGADSFNVAFERAMAIAARNGSLKVAQGVADAAARNGHESDDAASDMPEDEKLGLLENIIYKFLRKVEAEREARLKGEVVAADFYLRQVTFIEVAFDMMSEGLGLNGWDLLRDFRRGGHGILEIAETPMSRTLDDKRRALWAKMAEPDRPEHPPEDYLEHHADHSTEPLECMRGGSEEEREAERARYAGQHAADAEAQAEWERQAQSAWGANEHGAAEHRQEEQAVWAGQPEDKDFDPDALDENGEDFADRAMRRAIQIARAAHPEDFDPE